MKTLNNDLARFVPRKEQTQALNFIKNTIENEKHKKFILMDLPTGVGKSNLVLMIIKYFLDEVNSKMKFDLLTCQKILQKQYVDDFQSITNLWGSDNYACNTYSCSCKQGKEFNKLNKTSCDNCPSDNARNEYISEKISLTNFHLYTVFSLFIPELLDNRGGDVLIIDEAHDIESVFSDFITVILNEGFIKKMKLNNSKEIIKKLNSIRCLDDFISYIKNYLSIEVDKTMRGLKREIATKDPENPTKINRSLKIDNILGKIPNKTESQKTIKLIGDLESFQNKIDHFIKDIKDNPDNWVIEINKNDNGINDIKVEPIWSHPYLDKYIFSRYKYVIMMSGTILDKDMFTYLNGIKPELATYYQIESPFLIKNRPIYYMPVGRMSFKDKESSWLKFIPWINKLLDKKYKDEKGIIHTNSFELVNWIQNDIHKDRLLLHTKDINKDGLIQTHISMDKPTVLCSPSMGTGVDLKDDYARFQIMLKVPYPSLASEKNKKRLETNKEWYSWRTVCTIIQQYGRAVRNKNDHAHFIILDGCFKDVLLYSNKYIPNYIQRAIKKVETNKR